MSDVAKAANVAKGTVFLYFPTKEALFLALLEEEMRAWVTEVCQALAHGPGRFTPDRVGHVVANSLARRDVFTRLLPLLDSVLEQNVGVERIIEFKTFLLGQMAELGGHLEQRLRLPPGQGGPLLLQIYALLVGLRQLSDPCPAAAEALAVPALAPLTVDFIPQLEIAVAALIRGSVDKNP